MRRSVLLLALLVCSSLRTGHSHPAFRADNEQQVLDSGSQDQPLKIVIKSSNGQPDTIVRDDGEGLTVQIGNNVPSPSASALIASTADKYAPSSVVDGNPISVTSSATVAASNNPAVVTSAAATASVTPPMHTGVAKAIPAATLAQTVASPLAVIDSGNGKVEVLSMTVISPGPAAPEQPYKLENYAGKLVVSLDVDLSIPEKPSAALEKSADVSSAEVEGVASPANGTAQGGTAADATANNTTTSSTVTEQLPVTVSNAANKDAHVQALTSVFLELAGVEPECQQPATLSRFADESLTNMFGGHASSSFASICEAMRNETERIASIRVRLRLALEAPAAGSPQERDVLINKIKAALSAHLSAENEQIPHINENSGEILSSAGAGEQAQYTEDGILIPPPRPKYPTGYIRHDSNNNVNSVNNAPSKHLLAYLDREDARLARYLRQVHDKLRSASDLLNQSSEDGTQTEQVIVPVDVSEECSGLFSCTACHSTSMCAWCGVAGGQCQAAGMACSAPSSAVCTGKQRTRLRAGQSTSWNVYPFSTFGDAMKYQHGQIRVTFAPQLVASAENPEEQQYMFVPVAAQILDAVASSPTPTLAATSPLASDNTTNAANSTEPAELTPAASVVPEPSPSVSPGVSPSASTTPEPSVASNVTVNDIAALADHAATKAVASNQPAASSSADRGQAFRDMGMEMAATKKRHDHMRDLATEDAAIEGELSDAAWDAEAAFSSMRIDHHLHFRAMRDSPDQGGVSTAVSPAPGISQSSADASSMAAINPTAVTAIPSASKPSNKLQDSASKLSAAKGDAARIVAALHEAEQQRSVAVVGMGRAAQALRAVVMQLEADKDVIESTLSAENLPDSTEEAGQPSQVDVAGHDQLKVRLAQAKLLSDRLLAVAQAAKTVTEKKSAFQVVSATYITENEKLKDATLKIYLTSIAYLKQREIDLEAALASSDALLEHAKSVSAAAADDAAKATARRKAAEDILRQADMACREAEDRLRGLPQATTATVDTTPSKEMAAVQEAEKSLKQSIVLEDAQNSRAADAARAVVEAIDATQHARDELSKLKQQLAEAQEAVEREQVISAVPEDPEAERSVKEKEDFANTAIEDAKSALLQARATAVELRKRASVYQKIAAQRKAEFAHLAVGDLIPMSKQQQIADAAAAASPSPGAIAMHQEALPVEMAASQPDKAPDAGADEVAGSEPAGSQVDSTASMPSSNGDASVPGPGLTGGDALASGDFPSPASEQLSTAAPALLLELAGSIDATWAQLSATAQYIPGLVQVAQPGAWMPVVRTMAYTSPYTTPYTSPYMSPEMTAPMQGISQQLQPGILSGPSQPNMGFDSFQAGGPQYIMADQGYVGAPAAYQLPPSMQAQQSTSTTGAPIMFQPGANNGWMAYNAFLEVAHELSQLPETGEAVTTALQNVGHDTSEERTNGTISQDVAPAADDNATSTHTAENVTASTGTDGSTSPHDDASRTPVNPTASVAPLNAGPYDTAPPSMSTSVSMSATPSPSAATPAATPAAEAGNETAVAQVASCSEQIQLVESVHSAASEAVKKAEDSVQTIAREYDAASLKAQQLAAGSGTPDQAIAATTSAGSLQSLLQSRKSQLEIARTTLNRADVLRTDVRKRCNAVALPRFLALDSADMDDDRPADLRFRMASELADKAMQAALHFAADAPPDAGAIVPTGPMVGSIPGVQQSPSPASIAPSAAPAKYFELIVQAAAAASPSQNAPAASENPAAEMPSQPESLEKAVEVVQASSAAAGIAPASPSSSPTPTAEPEPTSEAPAAAIPAPTAATAPAGIIEASQSVTPEAEPPLLPDGVDETIVRVTGQDGRVVEIKAVKPHENVVQSEAPDDPIIVSSLEQLHAAPPSAFASPGEDDPLLLKQLPSGEWVGRKSASARRGRRVTISVAEAKASPSILPQVSPGEASGVSNSSSGSNATESSFLELGRSTVLHDLVAASILESEQRADRITAGSRQAGAFRSAQSGVASLDAPQSAVLDAIDEAATMDRESAASINSWRRLNDALHVVSEDVVAAAPRFASASRDDLLSQLTEEEEDDADAGAAESAQRLDPVAIIGRVESRTQAEGWNPAVRMPPIPNDGGALYEETAAFLATYDPNHHNQAAAN